jgi:hypothetical protein
VLIPRAGGPPGGGPPSNATGGRPGNATGGAPDGKMMGDPARMAMFAARHAKNVRNLEYYAAALCGIIAVFIFLHWARLLVTRSKPAATAVTKPFVIVSR